MTHLMALDDWDSDGIPKKVDCNCAAGRDHHQADCTCPEAQPHGSNPVPPTTDPDCPVHAMPSPLKPWQPLTDEDKRKADHWISDFIKTLPVQVDPMPAKPITAADIQAAMRKIGEAGYAPRRIEPIKLTPGQWAVLPHGDPRIPPYARPLGDLLGIPVVMVGDEAESTPVVEGWLKPKRKPRWWVRVWRSLRGGPTE